MANILLVTDAWHPQTNGVVTTLSNLVHQARQNNDKIIVVHPGTFRIKFPMPTYKEIMLAFPMPWTVRKHLKKELYDHIHIATPEGPIGILFARTCRRLNIPFSTSLHTLFPEFVKKRFPFVSLDFGWKWMLNRYKDTTHIMTTSDSMVEFLKRKGFTQELVAWTRGVDRSIFFPDPDREKFKRKGTKVLVCVSRVSHEKGLDDFCELKIPNTEKILVGDGPYLKTLKKKYPDVYFVGKKTGNDLARYYQGADVFVFPSKADTFGVVQIEALACGTPVAAYPVIGPKDIVKQGINGYMENNLTLAINQALHIDRHTVYKSSLKWSWKEAYKQFRLVLLPAK
jgi:glycosyltransferase involved in cell wall biosynthesis